MQFPATFVQVAEKPPPSLSLTPSPSSTSPSLPSLSLHQEQGIYFRLDLSISCNFQQLWFQVAERPPSLPPSPSSLPPSLPPLPPLPLSPPPSTSPLPLPRNREILFDWIYPFHAISSNFGFRWQKSPPPSFLPFHQKP